jgi:hypothetical protein
MSKKIESLARKKSEDLSYDEVRAFVERSGCLDAIADSLTKLCIAAKDKAVNIGLYNTRRMGRIYTANLNKVVGDVVDDDTSITEQVEDCIGKYVEQDIPPEN